MLHPPPAPGLPLFALIAVIAVLDNRDSFVWNLVQLLAELGAQVRLVRAGAGSLEELAQLAPDRLLIGPGPGRPEDAHASLAALRLHGRRLPVLGVCLGHQAIACAFGGRVRRDAEPVHGRATPIAHDGRGLFCGLPSPLEVGRYNSLVVDEAEIPAELEVSARDARGAVMALRHRTLPIEGVQFHPESILSEHGRALLANFLAGSGASFSAEQPDRPALRAAARPPASNAATGRSPAGAPRRRASRAPDA